MNQENQNFDNEPYVEKPQKFKIWKTLILIFVFLTVSISGLLVFLFLSPKNTQAQAESLVNLYFKVDHVRTDSAQIFAELMEIKRSPERVSDGEQKIGEKPYLSKKEELLEEILNNRKEVESVIFIIQSEEFSSREVQEVHSQLEEFYKELFEFEDKIIKGLEEIQDDIEFGYFMSNIAEDNNNLPLILEKDKKLRESLVTLAEKNNIKFANISYIDKSRERMIELDTNKIDTEKVGYINRKYTIPEDFRKANFVVTFGPEIDITDLVFGLRRDDTGKVMNFMISEAPPENEVYQIVINELPQSDTNENITASILPSELYPTVDINKSYQAATINYEKYVLLLSLYPNDPILSPVPGDWTLFVMAPGGAHIVMGESIY